MGLLHYVGIDREYVSVQYSKNCVNYHALIPSNNADVCHSHTSLIRTPFIWKSRYPEVIPGDHIQFSNIQMYNLIRLTGKFAIRTNCTGNRSVGINDVPLYFPCMMYSTTLSLKSRRNIGSHCPLKNQPLSQFYRRFATSEK